MQCGLRALADGTIEGVIFTLVDHPNPDPSTISALLASPRPVLAIPRYRERRGHPVYFGAELIPEFLALPPESQAKSVFACHIEQARFADVDDPGILDDVDDPAAYRRLLESA
jgi:molybdenum cofactor cytidylyltransferase